MQSKLGLTTPIQLLSYFRADELILSEDRFIAPGEKFVRFRYASIWRKAIKRLAVFGNGSDDGARRPGPGAGERDGDGGNEEAGRYDLPVRTYAVTD